MLALKEFVNFLRHNKTNLASTYAELLGDFLIDYERVSSESRLASARKLLNGVIEAFEMETTDPLCRLFDPTALDGQQRWSSGAGFPDPSVEIECLGQTLFPVVTNLEAGKFLWKILAEGRRIIRLAGYSPIENRGVTRSFTSPSTLNEYYDDTTLEQLRQSEERYRAFSEATLEMVVIIQDGFVVDANEQATAIFKMDRMDAIGKSVLEFVAEESVERVKEALFSQDGKPYETKFRRMDGTFFYGEITGKALIHKGQPARVAAIRDISERKQFEEALAKRARELELVAKVSEQAATTRNLTQMLQDVTDLTKDRFQLYHAHIYLLNERGDTLELVAGAGEAGRQMIAQGWSIPFDREDSLVAQAARTRLGVIVNDVRQNPGFLPNPLLPETRSEMAIPMITTEKVVGVLDVQGDQVGQFTDEDVWIQTTLASQIATAWDNVRLLQVTEKRVEREQTIREITEKMRSAVNLEQLASITAQELGQRLAAEFVAVDLGRENTLNPEGVPPMGYSANMP